MKKIFTILLFLSSWGYSQQEIELCGYAKTHSYWAPYVGAGTTEWVLYGDGINEVYTGNEISLTWSDIGTYFLSAVRYSGPCPSNEVVLVINVTQCKDLIYYVPNSFTPNDDDLNEVWGPMFNSGYDTEGYRLIVANRWGEIIFETNDINGKWDGTFEGMQCQKGVYSWLMDFKVAEGPKKYQISGHVNLIK